MATNVQIASPWLEALQAEFSASYFEHLVSTLKQKKLAGTTIYPPGPFIFNAYNSTMPDDVKVVLIGQDPYHNEGEAMGLSFSVPKGIKIPPSLKNIYKELTNDVGFTPPDHGDLSAWAHQGVFLLNACLTVEKNKAGSHKDLGWQTFTDKTIAYLSTHRQHLVFMLWGNFAKSKMPLIDAGKHLVLTAAHPSPLAGNAFQGCKHFSKTNEFLIRHSKTPIQWQI